MLNYQVMTEYEAMQERYQLLKDGIYDAVISASEDKVSANSGNPMMKLTLQVFDENGKSHTVKDFLVFTKSMMWKVIHFAESAGVLKEYEEGKLCSDIVVQKRVTVKISTEEGQEIPKEMLKGKAFGARFPDKNKVDDYVVNSEQKPAPINNTFVDDDVVF